MRMIGYAGIVALVVGCSHAATESEVKFNLAGAPTVQFSVPDMMCPESCAVKTKEILSKVPGAKDVIVDFETKTATVAVEEGKFDADAAIAALVDHGFDHSTLKTDAAANVVAKPQAAATPSVH